MKLNTIDDSGETAAIPGCSLIYAPSGQAGEYSALATNPYRGCGHKCAYCYVPNVLRMTRGEFDAGAVPRNGFIDKLKREAAKYKAAGITEQVMLSFTTDPYHPGDTSLTRQTIEVLRENGLGFCTLTKGGMRAMRDMDLFRPNRDAFASTLTSLDADFSRKWEAGAALPASRLSALNRFHAAGIFTWVSLEPVLDAAATIEIIRQTHGFVNLYKVGRVNYSGLTKTIDWERFTADVLEVLAKTGARHYIKNDLQSYLPAGYVNPKRVPQYHPEQEALARQDCYSEDK